MRAATGQPAFNPQWPWLPYMVDLSSNTTDTLPVYTYPYPTVTHCTGTVRRSVVTHSNVRMDGHHYKECGGSGIRAHGLSARSVARSLVAGTGSWPCLVHGGWFNRLQCDGDCDGAHVMLSASIKRPSQKQSQLKCVTKQRAPPPPPPPPVPNHKHAPGPAGPPGRPRARGGWFPHKPPSEVGSSAPAQN